MPIKRKGPVKPSRTARAFRQRGNYESRALVRQQIEDHGVEGTAQLAANKAERRRIEIMSAMLGEDSLDPGFLHSGLCMVSLPARKPVDDMQPWKRENGRIALTIVPGYVSLPGRPIEAAGMPYGARARLLLLYLQSEAVRTKSPVVSMGGSLSEWMRSIGIEHITGGRTGSIAQTYEQAKRLGFATFTLAWKHADGTGYGVIPNRTILREMDLWKGNDPHQGVLWPSTMELTPEFFASLRDHAVPFSREAIVKIKGSSLAIDLYVWLVYRLPKLKKNALVPWEDLDGQLGVAYGRLRDFKRTVIDDALPQVLAAYPDARVEPCDSGLLLKPSRPAIPAGVIHA